MLLDLLLGACLAAGALPAPPASLCAPPADPPAAVEVAAERVALPTGVTLAFRARGPGDGEAVLFLHGYTDSSLSFRPAIARLAELRPELRLVAVDLRGHGASSLPDPEVFRGAPERAFGPAQFAGDVLALLDALGLERAHLVGHSLGSFVAAELALARPDRVRSVTLIGTTARVAGNPVVEHEVVGSLVEGRWRSAVESAGLAWPRDAYARTPADVDPGAEAFLREHWVVEPAADPAFLEAILQGALRTPLGTWIGMPRAFATWDLAERLADLRVPALVLWAEGDLFFPEATDQAPLRAALRAAADSHGTPGHWKAYGRAGAAPASALGHNVPWSAHETLARDLAAFLRDGGAPTRDLPRAAPDGAVVVEPGAARVVSTR